MVDDNEYTLEEVEDRRNKRFDHTKESEMSDINRGLNKRNSVLKYRKSGNNIESNHGQHSHNKSREPTVHSTSQFIAQPEMEPSFIPLKNKRKPEVEEDDLEVHILDDTKQNKKSKNKFIKNKWIQDLGSGRGDQLEDLQSLGSTPSGDQSTSKRKKKIKNFEINSSNKRVEETVEHLKSTFDKDESHPIRLNFEKETEQESIRRSIVNNNFVDRNSPDKKKKRKKAKKRVSDNIIPLHQQEDASPGNYVSIKSLQLEEYKDDESPQDTSPYVSDLKAEDYHHSAYKKRADEETPKPKKKKKKKRSYNNFEQEYSGSYYENEGSQSRKESQLEEVENSTDTYHVMDRIKKRSHRKSSKKVITEFRDDHKELDPSNIEIKQEGQFSVANTHDFRNQETYSNSSFGKQNQSPSIKDNVQIAERIEDPYKPSTNDTHRDEHVSIKEGVLERVPARNYEAQQPNIEDNSGVDPIYPRKKKKKRRTIKVDRSNIVHDSSKDLSGINLSSQSIAEPEKSVELSPNVSQVKLDHEQPKETRIATENPTQAEASVERKKRKKKKKKVFDFQKRDNDPDFENLIRSSQMNQISSLNVAYPPKPEPDKMSDQFSDKNSSQADLNIDGGFGAYPMKPEADKSLSIGDDELGTITPDKVSGKAEDFTNTLYDYNKEHGYHENSGRIEISKKPKKRKSKKSMNRSEMRDYKPKNYIESSVKPDINEIQQENEIEYKRDGSMAPDKRKESGRIWGKYDPEEEYSPIKKADNKILMSERKKSRRDMASQGQPRVNFSTEKKASKPRVDMMNRNSQRGNTVEEKKQSTNSQQRGILKKTNMPLYSRSGTKRREAKPNLHTKDFNDIQLKNAMLKENYEGSSNPSSMYTMQTGKRSLKDRNRRRLAESIYGGAYSVTKKKSTEREKRSGSRKINFRSEGGGSSYKGSVERKPRPTKAFAESAPGIKDTLNK